MNLRFHEIKTSKCVAKRFGRRNDYPRVNSVRLIELTLQRRRETCVQENYRICRCIPVRNSRAYDVPMVTYKDVADQAWEKGIILYIERWLRAPFQKEWDNPWNIISKDSRT